MNVGIGSETAQFLSWEHKLDFWYSVDGNNLDELLVPLLHIVATISTSYRTFFVTVKPLCVHPDLIISEFSWVKLNISYAQGKILLLARLLPYFGKIIY
jgi:hypothetical protein